MLLTNTIYSNGVFLIFLKIKDLILLELKSFERQILIINAFHELIFKVQAVCTYTSTIIILV